METETELKSRSFRVVERTSTTVKCTELNELDESVQKYWFTSFNACVANGGWVLKDLGTDPNNPNPGRWDTPISLPYPQPSHEARLPPQTPNQAPVTLNSAFNGETIEEKPLPPRIGRGGRGKTRKHTNATTPNAEPSQSHEAMCRRTSNTQRSRWPLELPENALGKHPTAQQNTRATKRFRHPPQ